MLISFYYFKKNIILYVVRIFFSLLYICDLTSLTNTSIFHPLNTILNKSEVFNITEMLTQKKLTQKIFYIVVNKKLL